MHTATCSALGPYRPGQVPTVEQVTAVLEADDAWGALTAEEARDRPVPRDRICQNCWPKGALRAALDGPARREGTSS